MDISLLTYNIHKGFRIGNKRFILHEIRELIRSTGVDLVFLQEVIGENTRHAGAFTNWPTKTQYEFLADEVWQEYRYGRNAVYPSGHHGNAILSRLPIRVWSNLDISTSAIERRGLLHSEITLPNLSDTFHACCTHLSLRRKCQKQQISRICSWINENIPAQAPLIVAGDFNDWRDRASSTLKEAANLVEAVKETHNRLLPTFPARFPILRLDRIYVRGFEILSSEVQSQSCWQRLSDHVPVIAKLRLAIA